VGLAGKNDRPAVFLAFRGFTTNEREFDEEP